MLTIALLLNVHQSTSRSATVCYSIIYSMELKCPFLLLLVQFTFTYTAYILTPTIHGPIYKPVNF